MSYVPATFTAGVALMMTAAGAVGGQYVTEMRESLADTPSATRVVAAAESRRQPLAELPSLGGTGLSSTTATLSVDVSRAYPPVTREVQAAPKFHGASSALPVKIQLSKDELRRMLKAEASQQPAKTDHPVKSPVAASR